MTLIQVRTPTDWLKIKQTVKIRWFLSKKAFKFIIGNDNDKDRKEKNRPKDELNGKWISLRN